MLPNIDKNKLDRSEMINVEEFEFVAESRRASQIPEERENLDVNTTRNRRNTERNLVSQREQAKKVPNDFNAIEN